MTNLDQCWKNQLRLSGWVADVYDGTVDVLALKRKWLKRHRFTKPVIAHCFFCQWAKEHGEKDFQYTITGCPQCPGRLVDPRFMCGNWRYSYDIYPKEFYAKLLQLNRKRLKQADKN